MGKTNFIRKDPNDPLATFSAEELNAIYDAINNIEGALVMQVGTEDAEIPDSSIASLSATKLLPGSDASIRHLALAGDLTVQGISTLRGSVRLDSSALLTVKNASGVDIIKIGQYDAQNGYHGLVVTDGTNTNILVDDTGAVTVRGIIYALSGSSVSGTLSVSGQIVSTAAQGTAPLVVASSTLVANLNVDKVDGCDVGTGANNIPKLDSSGFIPLANIPGTLTGKDIDKLDGYHASTGTNASTIPVRDASGKVPGSITGDAHTVDGAHAGTAANNVLLLDSNGLVPLGNIPSTLTGKSADKVGGKGLSDLVQNLGNVPSIQAGLEASRPTAGVAGRLYIATDTKAWWRDTGSAWDQIVGSHAANHASGSSDPITPASIGALSKAGDTVSGNLTLGINAFLDPVGGTYRENGLANIASRLAGRLLNRNPDFSTGTMTGYNTYDNNGSGRIVRSLVADDTAPNVSGQVMRVDYDPSRNTSTTTSPGFGGFHVAFSRDTGYLSTWGYKAGNRYIHRVIAKIPSGRTINFASNAYGSGGGHRWITSQAGTGDWQEYVAIQTIGNTGTFSSTGFWYITGGDDVAFTWDVATVQIIGIDEIPDTDRAPSLNVGYKPVDVGWGEGYFTGQVTSDVGFKVGTNTVWHAGNDGHGTGLVADKLDDLEATQFLRSDVDATMAKKLHFSDTSSNPKLTAYSVTSAATYTIIDKDAKVWRAVYNDLAEFMPKLEALEPGDVLAWRSSGVSKTRSASDRLVVGVYSDTFGFVLGGDSAANSEDNLDKYVPVAICGRVRVKALGPVRPGDLLEASDIPGVARASSDCAPGTIIGKALESLEAGLRRRIWMMVMPR